MDKSTFRHRLAVAQLSESQQHIFVRSDDGAIEHYWTADEQAFGPEQLGGHFDADPVVAPGGGLHLIGRSGARFLDWRWPGSGDGWLGAPTEVTLPGLSVADPEVIGLSDGLHVFAPSLDGPMRHWLLPSDATEWADPEVLTGDLADHQETACALSRGPGSIDLFAIAAADGGLLHYFLDQNGWHCERRSHTEFGRKLSGRPTAIAPTAKRMDVFAVHAGVSVHWGFDGRQWFDEENRLDSANIADDLTLVSAFARNVTLVARTRAADGSMGASLWDLDPEQGEWRGPQDVTSSPFPLTTWLSGGPDEQPHEGDSHPPLGQMQMLTRNADGSFTWVILTLTDKHSIDGRPLWEPEEFLLPLVDPPGPPTGLAPAVADADLLARRPDDLVVLGVRWNDAIEVAAGPPAELVAHVGARLVVTLPPQHVAEEVVFGDGPATTAHPEFTGGVPVWASSSAGPSRVVVTLDADTRWPLTVEGVLDALRHGHLAPAADLTDDGTQLELPYRLLVTPFRADGGDIVLDHTATVAAGPAGGVGLWNTRIAAAGTSPTASADLTLRALAADSADGFATSLSGGIRSRILIEKPTARIDRLRLSSLGGSLTASGAWETFGWDHVATLGRDQKVRTATQGVLYPFGNRAVYVETSERRLDSTRDGAIAHLRKHAVLIVTEPVRQLGPSRSFPFSTVELQRTTVEFGAQPSFTKKHFANQAVLDLISLEAVLIGAAAQLKPTILSGGVGAIPAEDLAFIEGLTTPEAAAAAGQFVDDWVAIKRMQDKIAALSAGASADVDVWFSPSDAASTAIRFPVRLAGPSGEVHVDVPLVFVADIRMDEGLLHPAYSSLADPDTDTQVRGAYRAAGGGPVSISPVRLDMVGSADPVPTDSPVVRRLNILGEQVGGGYLPRLGPVLDDPAAAPEDRWAFEMTLPELSTLVGHQDSGVPSLRVAFSPELLSGSPDPGLLFQAAVGVERLTTAFSSNSARSGGLAAPDLRIDGVARHQGAVHAATFLDQVAGADLDPGRFLDPAATLLGFSLAGLVNGADLSGVPQILSSPTPGQPPKVTMLWPLVPLKTTQGAFVTHDASTLDLEVTLAPDEQLVRCTIKDVTLAFPDRAEDSKLLEVDLGTIEFRQEGTKAPSIHVSGISTRFFGFLKLLDDLQNAVKFAGTSPAIRASDRGVTATFDMPVPDITTGGFQLTRLSFHGLIDVPFDKRPVTIGIAFASREDPFNVSVLALGGGGYVDIVLDESGLRRLEIALEFGADLEVSFPPVATGEVHAMGGIRVVDDNGFSMAAYLRFGGSVEVLGLVSVSVELLVTLTYIKQRNALVGRATMVLEVDLLLFSDSVELDTGEWVLMGDEHPALRRVPTPPIDPTAWRSYRSAFDGEALA
jgi:hypothetical protein